MKYPKLLLATCLIASLALSGCAKGEKTPTGNGASENDLSSILAAQSEMKKFKSTEEMKAYLENRSQSQSGVMSEAMDTVKNVGSSAMPAAAPSAMLRQGGGADGSYSGTNVQVQGVDEADIVKTDGNFIYAVTDQNLVIVKTNPADKPQIISTTKLQNRPQELYVSGDKLITFGYEDMSLTKMAVDMMPRSSATFLAVYDISDRAKPQSLRQLSFEGNYVSSRLINNNFYFITANYQYRILDNAVLPRVYENGAVISSDKSTDRYMYPDVFYIDTPASLDATTVTLLDLNALQAPLRSQVYMIPGGQTVYASTNALYLAYTKYLSEYQLRMTAARDMLANRFNERERRLIAAINGIDPLILSEDEKLGKINQVIEGYFARLSEEERVKVSEEVEAEFNRRYPNISRELETTVVHKIAFAGNELSYAGSGEVSGHLLNQYSLDEHNGNLRLATTRGRSWAMPFLFSGRSDVMSVSIAPAPVNESYNNVYVLDGSMNTIGALEDLAPKEQIYSARFVGDRGYLVTFKQTDPLFVIDLATPEKPSVVGEVKLPGFSNYLHPYDATTLIGVGREAIDKGEQGVEMRGLKISLFDVADQPKEITSVVLGGPGSDSIALYDYKAVLFDRERNLLAIPATLTKKDSSDYTVEFQGIIVFNVTATGIKERGRVAFRLPQNMSENNTYLDDSARRSLFIGNSFYSFSAATLKANRFDNLISTQVLDLPRPVQIDGGQIKPMPAGMPMIDVAR